MKHLTRYWIELENQELFWHRFGVTAYTIEDAIDLIMSKALNTEERPEIKTVIENVDIRDLEQNHVAPNIGIPVIRGVWYPNFGN